LIVVTVIPPDSPWLKKEIDSLANSSLRLAILAIIKRSGSEGIYGYRIGEELMQATTGGFDASNATFYAILRRLAKDDLITSQMRPSEAGPPRKHYFLTSEGNKALIILYQYWNFHYSTLKKLQVTQS
jgi:PadR family transcriptional regulator PadR